MLPLPASVPASHELLLVVVPALSEPLTPSLPRIKKNVLTIVGFLVLTTTVCAQFRALTDRIKLEVFVLVL